MMATSAINAIRGLTLTSQGKQTAIIVPQAIPRLGYMGRPDARRAVPEPLPRGKARETAANANRDGIKITQAKLIVLNAT